MDIEADGGAGEEYVTDTCELPVGSSRWFDISESCVFVPPFCSSREA